MRQTKRRAALRERTNPPTQPVKVPLAMQTRDIKETDLGQTEKDILREDAVRWKRMGAGSHLDEWLAYGPGLMIRRRLAMKLANTNSPIGRAYTSAFKQLMADDGMDAMDPNTVTAVLWLHDDPERLDVLRKLRTGMNPGQLSRLNSPITAKQRVAKTIDGDSGVTKRPSAQKQATVALTLRVIELEDALKKANAFDFDREPVDIAADILNRMSESKARELAAEITAWFAKQPAKQAKRKAKGPMLRPEQTAKAEPVQTDTEDAIAEKAAAESNVVALKVKKRKSKFRQLEWTDYSDGPIADAPELSDDAYFHIGQDEGDMYYWLEFHASVTAKPERFQGKYLVPQEAKGFAQFEFERRLKEKAKKGSPLEWCDSGSGPFAIWGDSRTVPQQCYQAEFEGGIHRAVVLLDRTDEGSIVVIDDNCADQAAALRACEQYHRAKNFPDKKKRTVKGEKDAPSGPATRTMEGLDMIAKGLSDAFNAQKK